MITQGLLTLRGEMTEDLPIAGPYRRLYAGETPAQSEVAGPYRRLRTETPAQSEVAGPYRRLRTGDTFVNGMGRLGWSLQDALQ